MKKYIITFLICFGVLRLIAQETDTTTLSCNCEDQTVYVRFGYNPHKDTTKTFIYNSDSISAKRWSKFPDTWKKYYRLVYNGKSILIGVDTMLALRIQPEQIADENTKIDTIAIRTFKYIPSNAVGFIDSNGEHVQYTKPFRFSFSPMESDDPEAIYYMKKLCNNIIKNKK